jgi:cystathionine beta-lyase
MQSGFDINAVKLAELQTHHSEKWRTFPSDVLPLPVAEMDFAVAQPIRDILTHMVAHSDLGYLGPIPELGRAFSQFSEKRWGWKSDPDQVRVAADVGVGVVEVLRVLTKPGDKILINSPVYPNFFTWSDETHLVQVDVPFTESDQEFNGSNWILDWEAVERAYASGIAVHLLCNPHNPLGRVYTESELSHLAELATKHGVFIVSDEIHAPLTFTEQRFIPFLSVSEAARQVGITITSSSKGWNIAGLKCAIIVTQNEQLHEKLKAIAPATHYRASLLGGFASVAAFEHGEPWLDDVMVQLDYNRKFLADLLAERFPSVRYRIPHSSYLAWLDLSTLNLGEDPAAVLLERAKVAFVPGIRFGKQCSQYVRLNFATSPEILREAITRIASVAPKPAKIIA